MLLTFPWSVGRSVWNETIRYPAKTAGPIELPFGMWGGVEDSHHVLDGGLDRPRDGALLGIIHVYLTPFEQLTRPVFAPAGDERLMFLPSTFFLFYWVYAVCRQVAGAVGHMDIW